MTDLSILYDSILNGKETLAVEIIKQTLNEPIDSVELINKWMIPTTDEAGKRFENQDFFFLELLIAGRTLKATLDVLH
jgi:methanogenic corrinoid protein MtbC1